MKQRKRSTRPLQALAALAIALGSACGVGPAWSQSNEVVTQDPGGTYGENLRRLVYDPFTKDTGIKVLTVQEARGGPRVKAQVEAKRTEWDLSFIFDQEVRLLDPYLAEIDYKKLSPEAQKTVASLPKEAVRPKGVALQVIGVALVYNKEAFPSKKYPKTWADFWNVKDFPGPRTMQNSPANLVMALLADGVPPEKIYPLDLDRAFKKMDELRPHIRSYWTSGDQPVQGVANGEFVAGTAWNGRVNAAMKAGKPVAPSWNGALLRVSWNFILKGAPHPRAAEALLYYMQRAEGQAELAKLSGYTGGNKNVVKSVDAELAEALATSPEHVKVASIVDAQWWADNNSAVQARWNAWVAKQ